MSDRDQTTGPARCACGRKAEPGMPGGDCAACAHGMLPEPARPDPVAQAALFRRTAAMLRRRASNIVAGREQCLADAAYFERRAAELER